MALGLSSHGDGHAGAVYPFLEDDCCNSNSCYRVLQTYARSPDAHVQLGSMVVLPGARWQAACALSPLKPLLGDSQLGYFDEARRAYEEIGCTIERVAEDRVSAALRDAGGAVSELTALRAGRKALLKALAAAATATGGTPIGSARSSSRTARALTRRAGSCMCGGSELPLSTRPPRLHVFICFSTCLLHSSRASARRASWWCSTRCSCSATACWQRAAAGASRGCPAPS